MMNLESRTPLLKAHFEVSPPVKLHHYTSPEALVGIMSHTEMWASHAMLLNDALEVKHGMQMIQELVDYRLIGEKDFESQEFLKQLKATIFNYLNDIERGGSQIRVLGKQVYIISFTELPDALSQWRGYCPASGGYAIGFPAEQIVDMSNEQSFRLVKCIYNYELKKSMLNELIDAAIEVYKIKKDEESPLNQSVIIDSVFFDYLLLVCSAMKHGSFEEEHEWRLILLHEKGSDQQIFYRTNTKGIIPYCKFKLLSPTFPDLVERRGGQARLSVRIGPSPNQRQRGLPTVMLLEQYLNKGDVAQYSDIPYQTW